MSDLTRIWAHASKTDASATKNNTAGGFKSTSVNGYWFFKKATELWGACGTGWGYEIAEERFDVGGPIFNADKSEKIGETKVHTMVVKLWYENQNQFVTAYGHTPFIYQSKHGITTDIEAPKKSLTDALKKALSMLGFASDIFMGEWDDQEYINERLRDEAVAKSVDSEAEKTKQAAEYKDKVTANLKTMGSAKTRSEIDGIFKVTMHEAIIRENQGAQELIQRAYDKALSNLEAEKNG